MQTRTQSSETKATDVAVSSDMREMKPRLGKITSLGFFVRIQKIINSVKMTIGPRSGAPVLNVVSSQSLFFWI